MLGTFPIFPIVLQYFPHLSHCAAVLSPSFPCALQYFPHLSHCTALLSPSFPLCCITFPIFPMCATFLILAILLLYVALVTSDYQYKQCSHHAVLSVCLSCTLLTPTYQYAHQHSNSCGRHRQGIPQATTAQPVNASDAYSERTPLGFSVGIPIMTEVYRGFRHYLDISTGQYVRLRSDCVHRLSYSFRP